MNYKHKFVNVYQNRMNQTDFSITRLKEFEYDYNIYTKNNSQKADKVYQKFLSIVSQKEID